VNTKAYNLSPQEKGEARRHIKRLSVELEQQYDRMIHEQQRMAKIVAGNDDVLERLLEHDEQQKEHVNEILAKSSQSIGSPDPKEDTSRLEKLIQNMKASLEAQLVMVVKLGSSLELHFSASRKIQVSCDARYICLATGKY
jgi:hypothetical protein